MTTRKPQPDPRIRAEWCVIAHRPDGKYICEFDHKWREVRDEIPWNEALYIKFLPYNTIPASHVVCPACGRTHEVTMHPKSNFGWSFHCPCGARGDWMDWNAPGKLRWEKMLPGRVEAWCYARPDGQILREQNWRRANERDA